VGSRSGQRREHGNGKGTQARRQGVWDSSGGQSVGKVVRKQTTPTRIEGHKVAASKDNPQYIVHSDKSSGEAAQKPGELKKA
jgi:Hypervirulence associated proteins TUDOR domain